MPQFSKPRAKPKSTAETKFAMVDEALRRIERALDEAMSIEFYIAGLRERGGKWYAVIFRHDGEGRPATTLRDRSQNEKARGPFKTKAEAQKVVDEWGKDLAGIYNTFK